MKKAIKFNNCETAGRVQQYLYGVTQDLDRLIFSEFDEAAFKNALYLEGLTHADYCCVAREALIQVQSPKAELEVALKDSTWFLWIIDFVIESNDFSAYLNLDINTRLFVDKLQATQRHPNKEITHIGSVCVRKVVSGNERQYYLQVMGDSMFNNVRFYPHAIVIS